MPKMGSNIIHYRSNFREENKFVLVNSCNGLLYFVRRHAPDELSLVCNPVTNEYLMIPDVDHESSLRSRTVGAQVLVVGSSSWRDIEVTLLGSDHSWDACSAFLNGVIYWLIIFFDFEREVFGDIALPPELGEEQEK
ncbi:hypothetical protein Pfo_025440 [Paulownia fortunei]|nr:hypothetical protein Pfo_025440 [Paulownia fortunei]